jgi:hypothetical protein
MEGGRNRWKYIGLTSKKTKMKMKMMIHKYVVNHEDIVSEVQLNPSMTGHPHRDEWKRK